MTYGIDLIAAERERQVSVEGWTPEHDDEHTGGELTKAALQYAEVGRLLMAGFSPGCRRIADRWMIPCGWPWDKLWWKPADDPITNLVKAGALIAAEIDRLQRARAT